MDAGHQTDGDEDHVSPAQVNQILRRKRKARERRACYPCRQRKVKCNYETPCQRCIDRDHVDLCSYQQAAKGPTDAEQLPNPPVTSSSHGPHRAAPDWNQLWSKLQTIEVFLRDIKNEVASHINSPADSALSVRQGNSPSQGTREANTTAVPAFPAKSGLVADGSVYLGCDSVPAMALALGSGNDEEAMQNVVGNSVLPLFGLDNESATYPFTDLWGLTDMPSRVKEVCKLIPSDADCFQHLRHYRDNAHVLYPAVVNIDRFETEMSRFLVTRSSRRSQVDAYVDQSSEIYGQTVHWLSLFFACLASGCQCSSLPRKERQLTAQVYGLTTRLAQTLGLHEPGEFSASPEEGRFREEIWWQIVWQDSLLSILFDRSPATSTIATTRPHHVSTHDLGKLSYINCMKRLCAAILDIVRDRSASVSASQEVSLILKHRDRLIAIMGQAAPHLTNVSASTCMRDQLEHWNLSLHLSYVMFDLHRATLRNQTDAALRHLRDACVDSLASTVHAYLGLQNVSSTTRTSWIATQRALSSALLLGIIKEHAKNQRVRTLLQDLLTVMTNLNSDTVPSEVPAPIARAIAALRRFLHSSDAMEVDNPQWSGHVSMQGSRDGSRSYDTSTFNSPILTPGKSPHNHSPFSLLGDILWGTQSMQVQGLYRQS
ncbi:hypothetical protein LTR99_000020 [Exophiala xenobiotica]|uniref:Zn(2)-C6 fungal-type domain-containing protein n=1 Tax=Vermiconidia calcicola TaxID=1690605 RepID=A0AAV9PVY0_9PEZI|nr:hypothetical protein LTR96_009198 [Exophiala xenobiotica]KAK5530168.1 hypothetical protein LTR25_009414 [Vermiconidia calcicola]KAK5547488.1 hypothetical protein LTR23_002710 [Chaetothyriales sp. CCFEE 6169]KAK5307052.1 hypothetical protein LTR99_000020 [Exophiala xenobiotica]KAK5344043.1 hypothetical protein LTR98_001676 [Exophiala xenobiotica]